MFALICMEFIFIYSMSEFMIAKQLRPKPPLEWVTTA